MKAIIYAYVTGQILPMEEYQELVSVFEAIDVNNDGYICEYDLMAAYDKYDPYSNKD